MGETRVDLQHLLEDLRDAYPGSIEETILTEIVANALDSGAVRVRLAARPAEGTLTVLDDGRGMQRRELARYHDVAATTKARGEGIGFAGVGIKLGLLVSREVVTETRRGASHVATLWSLASRHRAPWKWIPAPGLVEGRGTAVRLALASPLSPLLDGGFVEEALRRNFEPLFDSTFDAILAKHYPKGVSFEVDGRPLSRGALPAGERVPVAVRVGRRRSPSAIGYLERHAFPLREERQGIAISTYGKVIKRGWDWLGVTPAVSSRITGLVEVPDLAAGLTLNKCDFLRTGARAAAYLAYRKALQEVVSRQLAAWGDARDVSDPQPRTLRLARDLERVLEDLVDEFPLLDSLVDRRPGGQKRLPLPGRGDDAALPLFAGAAPTSPRPEAEGPPEGVGSSPPKPPGESPPGGQPPGADVRSKGGSSSSAMLSADGGRRRRARYGLTLQFEPRPGDPELGRLVESTIWVNEAHPAFTRALSSRSLGYHVALTVALALAPLAVQPVAEHGFVTRFLTQWGAVEVHGSRSPRTSGRRRSRRS